VAAGGSPAVAALTAAAIRNGVVFLSVASTADAEPAARPMTTVVAVAAAVARSAEVLVGTESPIPLVNLIGVSVPGPP
jgi:hypothetical protein